MIHLIFYQQVLYIHDKITLPTNHERNKYIHIYRVFKIQFDIECINYLEIWFCSSVEREAQNVQCVEHILTIIIWYNMKRILLHKEK